MVGQQLPQTNEKCYSVPQCPMWSFLPLFYGSKHILCFRGRCRIVGVVFFWKKIMVLLFSRPCLSTFFIKKKTVTDTILMRPNRAWPTQEHKGLKIEKHWKNTQAKTHTKTTASKQHGRGKHIQTINLKSPHQLSVEPAKKIRHRIMNPDGKASARTEEERRWQSIRPTEGGWQSIHPDGTTKVATRAEDHGDKASARTEYRWQSIHPKRMTEAAKYSPEANLNQQGGKASAKL